MAQIHSIGSALSILDEMLASASPEDILQKLNMTFSRIGRADVNEVIIAAQTLRAIADSDKRMRTHPGFLSLANAVRLRMHYLVLSVFDEQDTYAPLLSARLRKAWGQKRGIFGGGWHSLHFDIKRL